MNEDKLVDNNENKGLLFLADHFMRMYEVQNKNIDSFDQKVSWFLFFQSAILIFFISEHKALSVVLLVSIILNVISVFPRKFKIPYIPDKILNEFWGEGELKAKESQAKLVAHLSHTFSENSKIKEIKAKYGGYAIKTFLVFLILLLVKIFFESKLFLIYFLIN